MAVPVYLDLTVLAVMNFLLSFIAFGLPRRTHGVRVERGENERLPIGFVARTATIVIVSVIFGLLLIFGETPFLYQFLIDFFLVGLIVSSSRLRDLDSPRRTASVLVILF